jgi:hypothetical protein
VQGRVGDRHGVEGSEVAKAVSDRPRRRRDRKPSDLDDLGGP